jgi:MFS family permease
VLPVAKEGKSPKIFSGYIQVCVSLLILIVMHGLFNTYGVFFNSLQTEFNWDRATISGASSLAFFLMGLFATVGGRLTDKHGPKLTMVLSSLILGLGYLLMSQVSTLWQLYLFYGVIIGIGASSGDVTLLPTVARWFVKRRGLMTSIVKVGTGIGIFIMPAIAGWLIVTYNWRAAYVVFVIVALAGIIPLAQLLKRDPSILGLQADGTTPETGSNQNDNGLDLTLREAVHTRQFWLICVAYFLVWYTTQSVMIHIAAHSIDTGLSITQAASLVSSIGGVSIIGRLTMGGTSDKIGNRNALVICFVLLLIALIWLQFAQGLWMLYLFVLVYGFAHGGFFAVVSPLVAEFFGIKSHGTNLGMLFFFGQTGGALGPIVTGRIFDLTHSYELAFVILLAAAAVGLVLAILLKPVRLREFEYRP